MRSHGVVRGGIIFPVIIRLLVVIPPVIRRGLLVVIPPPPVIRRVAFVAADREVLRSVGVGHFAVVGVDAVVGVREGRHDGIDDVFNKGCGVGAADGGT